VSNIGQSIGNACATIISAGLTGGAANNAGLVSAPAIAAYRLTAAANTALRVPNARASPFCFFISCSPFFYRKTGLDNEWISVHCAKWNFKAQSALPRVTAERIASGIFFLAENPVPIRGDPRETTSDARTKPLTHASGPDGG
jgi:hypothetical protein